MGVRIRAAGECDEGTDGAGVIDCGGFRTLGLPRADAGPFRMLAGDWLAGDASDSAFASPVKRSCRALPGSTKDMSPGLTQHAVCRWVSSGIISDLSHF